MISKDKTYCTRGGQEVRIYATDAGGLFPVHGAIFQDGTWHGMKWTEEGKTHFTTTSCMVNTVDDLVEVKPRHKRTVWLNMHDFHCFAWSSKEHADMQGGRIACIKVDLDFEEGEGLTEAVYSTGTSYTIGNGGSHSFNNGGGFTIPKRMKITEEGL